MGTARKHHRFPIFEKLTETEPKHSDLLTLGAESERTLSSNYSGSPFLEDPWLCQTSSPAGGWTQLEAHRRNFSAVLPLTPMRDSPRVDMHMNSARSAHKQAERKARGKLRKNPLRLEERGPYIIDLNRIELGLDTRTSLMIRNIPNKYTQKMLLETIDKEFSETYDFLYLPIDYNNKCNVGYAFINFKDPKVIIPFYRALNGQRWERFHSRKLRELAYARIQGVNELSKQFERSSVMFQSEDMRPVIKKL